MTESVARGRRYRSIARWAGRKQGDRSLKWTLFVGAVQLCVGFLGMALARRVKPDQLRIGILAIGITLTVVYFVKAYIR